MWQAISRIPSYIAHQLTATGRHGVHSPFVYGLIDGVIRAEGAPPNALQLERLRAQLLRDTQVISVTDHGAGPGRGPSGMRTVREIARTSMKPVHQAELLFRLAKARRPRTILELGTSFGHSTMYLAEGAPDSQVHTIEGCPEIHQQARKQFVAVGHSEIHAHCGRFQDILPGLLPELDPIDLAFIDGHHSEDATLALFEMIATHGDANTWLVLDDIHWSQGMENAWKAIQERPRVMVTIDLFHMGLVFFHSGQAKEHFRVRL
ncbi:MAG: class I SAM-dependent methyltransferase [Flavobacteriales bacterium]|nr:class I SAM-dependent methyltransferase [Flavobacteriales bacterium]